jgi:hypothetical protein
MHETKHAEKSDRQRARDTFVQAKQQKKVGAAKCKVYNNVTALQMVVGLAWDKLDMNREASIK